MAIPTLSESGSVAITRSALIFLAIFIASSNAADSSGLGDLTVGKFPSGLACSSTIYTLSKPKRFKTLGTRVAPVP